MMELDRDDQLGAYTLTLARQQGLDGVSVVQAIASEDVVALTELLGRDQPAVTADLNKLHRALVVDGDWGAGCAILTAEVRTTAEAALATLITGRNIYAPAS